MSQKEGARARKEVRFNDAAETLTENTKRRDGRRLSAPTIEHDEEPEHSARPTYEDFKREVTDCLDDVRYRRTTDDLVSETQVKIAQFADIYQKKTRTREPGMPLQVWVDGNDIPDVTGVVDADEFAKLVASSPHEVFMEVKLRCFMAMAYAEQVKELHATAQELDNNMRLIHDWVPALLENSARDRGGASATDREEELLATVADQSEEIARLRTDVVHLNEAIADLVVQSRLNSTTLPSGRNGDDDDHLRRENSVFSQTSVAGGKRSSKAPDPPIFHNEKDRDTEDFEQWYRDIENKLTVNADHFVNDKARQAYIESRLGGKAKRELAPYLRDTHPEPIKTSDRLLTHLWDQYYNPLLAQKALDDYDDLKMGPGADYLAFKNDFVRLAGECGKARAEWKREFNRRLTPNL